LQSVALIAGYPETNQASSGIQGADNGPVADKDPLQT